MLVEGDSTVTRSRVSGTHSGTFDGLPPTGRRFETDEIAFSRWEGDRIVEEWRLLNVFAILSQLDLLPEPGLGGLIRFGGKLRRLAREATQDGAAPKAEPRDPSRSPQLLDGNGANTPEKREELRQRFRRVFTDVINESDLAAAHELLSPDVVFRAAGQPEPFLGPDAFTGFIAQLRSGFPDLVVDVRQIVVDGAFAGARVRTTATNTGAFEGFPPAGRRVQFAEMVIARFDDELQGAEVKQEANLVSILRQLRIMPEPGLGGPAMLGFLAGTLKRELRAKVRRG